MSGSCVLISGRFFARMAQSMDERVKRYRRTITVSRMRPSFSSALSSVAS